MTRVVVMAAALIAVAAGGVGAGHWLGRQGAPVTTTAAAPSAVQAPERKILYYQDPTGKPDYSAEPKKDAEGRDFVPVFEEEEPAAAASSKAQPTGKNRKVLYYRNPMGLPDTSPVPKKDWMGMDYIAVYEGEEQEEGNTVKVSLERVQRLGVRTEPVTRRSLMQPVRAVGTVQFDERRLGIVSTKFEGWIEKLLVSATGEPVRRGQPLMQVYSPDLVQAQQEYVIGLNMVRSLPPDASQEARRTAQAFVNGALQRLRNLDFPDDELQRLRRDGAASRLVTLRSPSAGIVLEKVAVEGMRFMPGEPLYRLADISSVWVVAEVFEQDLGLVAVGQTAKVVLKAYPTREFQGRISFIYPTLARETRTAKVRIELPNPEGLLRSDMYAEAVLAAPVGRSDAPAVPDSAVIDSGARQIVLVDRGEGRYEPREVRLGAKADGYVEVIEGVQPGERVVVAANFLIDAESNLKAALRGFTAPEAPTPGVPK